MNSSVASTVLIHQSTLGIIDAEQEAAELAMALIPTVMIQRLLLSLTDVFILNTLLSKLLVQ